MISRQVLVFRVSTTDDRQGATRNFFETNPLQNHMYTITSPTGSRQLRVATHK